MLPAYPAFGSPRTKNRCSFSLTSTSHERGWLNKGVGKPVEVTESGAIPWTMRLSRTELPRRSVAGEHLWCNNHGFDSKLLHHLQVLHGARTDVAPDFLQQGGGPLRKSTAASNPSANLGNVTAIPEIGGLRFSFTPSVVWEMSSCPNSHWREPSLPMPEADAG